MVWEELASAGDSRNKQASPSPPPKDYVDRTFFVTGLFAFVIAFESYINIAKAALKRCGMPLHPLFLKIEEAHKTYATVNSVYDLPFATFLIPIFLSLVVVLPLSVSIYLVAKWRLRKHEVRLDRDMVEVIAFFIVGFHYSLASLLGLFLALPLSVSCPKIAPPFWSSLPLLLFALLLMFAYLRLIGSLLIRCQHRNAGNTTIHPRVWAAVWLGLIVEAVSSILKLPILVLLLYWLL